MPKKEPKDEPVKLDHKNELIRLLELIVIVGFSTSPLFIFAAKIDDDEWWKTAGAVSIAIVAGVVAACYRLWKKP